MPGIRPTVGDSSWFVRDRFGLFIHWGVYAAAARHEWVMQREEIPAEEYEKYAQVFDPDLHDPDQWAATAAEAGMKYFVITTKHHDGFCLWDSDLTDYKATNTPAGRDLIAPMVKAFRERGLRVGFYHSLIDWHHPDFVIDDRHALRNHPDRAEMNKRRDQKKYIKYLHGQVRELLTRYGKIDTMFYDFSYPSKSGPSGSFVGKGRDDWDSEGLIKMTRELQPHILVDNRADLNDKPYGWDYMTPEQFEARAWPEYEGQKVVWETCQTFSGAWGYARDEESWKSTEQLVQMLANTVSKGGNMLLNVGPTARGEFDGRAMERLRGIGEWMKRHSRAIYGCTQAPEEFPAPRDCRLTWNPETKRMYVHVFTWPFRHLHLEGQAFVDRVWHAQLLNDGSELRSGPWGSRHAPSDLPPALTLHLPAKRPNVTVPVIELFLK